MANDLAHGRKQKLITGWRTSKIQRLGREFVWIALGQALAVAGSFIGVRVLTELLSPGIYGQVSLGMTVALLVNQLLLGPLGAAGLRFFSASREEGSTRNFLLGLRSLFTKVIMIVLLLAVGTSALLLILGKQAWMLLSILALSVAIFTGFNSLLDNLQNAMRHRKVVAWHQALSAWLRFLAAGTLVLLFGASSVAVMFGYVLASLLVSTSQLALFRKAVRGSIPAVDSMPSSLGTWESRMVTYAWPFMMWGVFAWAQIASDRWALQLFASSESVGLYAVLYQIGYYPITVLTGLVVKLVSPVLFQRAGSGTDKARIHDVHTLTWRLTMLSLLMTFLAAAAAAGLHNLVFDLFVAPEYRSVSWLLAGMVLAGGMFATGQFAVISLLAGTETNRLLPPKIGTAIIGVALNALGAYGWGIAGVVGASILTSALYLCWILYIVRAEITWRGTR